ncbi:hypothetical protein [Pectobacterium versatile]|uniref:hypothetical protein n=1 Tax=Pectobacterium versatile TaxID=2488639 RepID=UPI001CD054A5|nr:hypothetical protein [Pectobacterium versatile]
MLVVSLGRLSCCVKLHVAVVLRIATFPQGNNFLLCLRFLPVFRKKPLCLLHDINPQQSVSIPRVARG